MEDKKTIDINDFFVEDKIEDINIKGLIFKYRIRNAGAELDWNDDYLDEVEVEVDGIKKKILKPNRGKLSVCKLRNIIEVPFTKEQLQKITNINKNYKDFTNQEKDLLFRKLHPDVYSELILIVDKVKNKKKE